MTKTLKAIIPVAGAGKQLRPFTYSQPKPLIPVAGKPIISFIIDQLRGAGVEEFVFVIGYMGDKIRDYIDSKYPTIKKEYVFQATPLGLGHAIWLTKTHMTANDEIILLLGDSIVELDLKAFVQLPNTCLAIQKVANPGHFGVVELDDDRSVSKVSEKPRIPKSNLALVGLYKFCDAMGLMNILDDIITHDTPIAKEDQLAEAINRLVKSGQKISVQEVNNWYDCGRKEILLETNATLLKKYNFYKSKQHQFENSIIIPPVAIGENCHIDHSIIGPYVTIGNDSQISNSIVKNSILSNDVSITDIVLHDSVIGNDTVIKGSFQSLNIGNNTEIVL